MLCLLFVVFVRLWCLWPVAPNGQSLEKTGKSANAPGWRIKGGLSQEIARWRTVAAGGRTAFPAWISEPAGPRLPSSHRAREGTGCCCCWVAAKVVEGRRLQNQEPGEWELEAFEKGSGGMQAHSRSPAKPSTYCSYPPVCTNAGTWVLWFRSELCFGAGLKSFWILRTNYFELVKKNSWQGIKWRLDLEGPERLERAPGAHLQRSGRLGFPLPLFSVFEFAWQTFECCYSACEALHTKTKCPFPVWEIWKFLSPSYPPIKCLRANLGTTPPGSSC